MKSTKEIINHYIVPIRNFKIHPTSRKFEFIFDKNLKLKLKYFSYEDHMERVDADEYSIFDQMQLKVKYNWGIRFDCNLTKLNTYIENINLLMLAFRIFDEADCSFQYILNVSNTHSSIKNIDNWKRSINTIKHPSNFKIEDLIKIKEGYLRLQKFFSISARTKHCIQFLYLGYISFYWMQGFILLMTSLETLVSPNIRSEKITSIIISRIMKLLTDKSICSKTQLDKIYDLRSKIVHGKITTDIEMKKVMPHVVRLQKVVLSVFNNILQNNLSNIYCNKIEFENFFK
jgi:hypothetical protein